jgi:hypothetical protein
VPYFDDEAHRRGSALSPSSLARLSPLTVYSVLVTASSTFVSFFERCSIPSRSIVWLCLTLPI